LSNLSKEARFIWGAATSSYQVEGGIANNDWNFFTTSESIRRRIYKITKPSIFYRGYNYGIKLENAGKASRVWERIQYLRDFELAKSLGMTAFRISLEWARIEPRRGEWNNDALSRYREMIYSMKERGLTPIVTINHLTLPTWVLTPPSRFKKKMFQYFLSSPLRELPLGDPPADDPYWKSLRGWENYDTVDVYLKFVEKVVTNLKDLVDYWITLGEPVASVIGGGYLAGIYPPGFFLDGNRAKKALHNLIEAHIQAYDLITNLDDIDADLDGKSKRVGVAHLMVAVTPGESHNLLSFKTGAHNEAAASNFSYFINDYFLNAIINGEEDVNYLDTLKKLQRGNNHFIVHEKWNNKIDFIGLNYYRRVHVYYNKIVSSSSARFVGGIFLNNLHGKDKRQGMLNDLGWEIYPQGLYDIIMKIKRNWNKPILVTENGVADRLDRFRAPFIVGHLHQVNKAMKDGAEIIGYIHWSFMDNYEWLEGYRQEAKFGLFYVNYNEAEKKQFLDRELTKGAQALKLIIRESSTQDKYDAVTDSALSKAKEIFGSFTSDGSSIL
jgi:beta-glucosidase